MQPIGKFVHHRLDVYRRSLVLLRLVQTEARRVPRGYRSFADQILRAAGETAALIGEGANRFTHAQKRQRFAEARGEAAEVAVHAEILAVMGVMPEDKATAIMTEADRVCAMLTKLIRRHG